MRLVNAFKGPGAVEINVERFESDPNCTAPQLTRFPVFTGHQLIVLKSLHRLFRCCRLDRILGSRRPAGLNSISKSLAEHAYRTEFHRSRKLTATVRAGALGLRAHGPNRPSAAI